jgi:hypothetical protein
VKRREEGSLVVEAIEDSANLLDQTKQIWQRTLGDIAPLVVIGVAMGRRLGAGEAAVLDLDRGMRDEFDA